MALACCKNSRCVLAGGIGFRYLIRRLGDIVGDIRGYCRLGIGEWEGEEGSEAAERSFRFGHWYTDRGRGVRIPDISESALYGDGGGAVLPEGGASLAE